MTLIKISLLACDNSFASYPCNLFQIYCLICVNLSFLLRPTSEGRPGYFSYGWTTVTSSIPLITVCISSVLELLTKSVVFVLSICCPKAHSYLAKIPSKLWHSLYLDLQKKIKLSFEKRRCVSLGLFWQSETPLISPFVAALFIKPCSLLVHMRKIYGEKGSPYRSPLVG